MFGGISYHLLYLVRSALVVGVWQEREMKGGTGRVLFVFSSLVYLLASRPPEGSTKGNNIGQIVFRSQRASEVLRTLCLFAGNNVVSGKAVGKSERDCTSLYGRAIK